MEVVWFDSVSIGRRQTKVVAKILEVSGMSQAKSVGSAVDVAALV